MRHLRLHRPSAATVISLVALLFALGGTAVAATGSSFLLGRSNTATRVSSLKNTRGTALSLTSTSRTPPLTVSNSLQVPRLNASELGGHSATFFMHGVGDTIGARFALTGSSVGPDFILVSNADIGVLCDQGGPKTGSQMAVAPGTGTVPGATAEWWNAGGVDVDTNLHGQSHFVTPVTTAPFMVVVQVDNVHSISTFTLSEWYDSGTDTCHFTGQVVTTNGGGGQ